MILTDEPVTDLATALTVAFWYACRWLIEEYHKCLKSGCRVESRQLEEAGRLKSLLGVLAVVAVRLLQLKHQAKVNPDAPALSVVPARYVRTLAAHLKRSPGKMTTREFWRETARMGGFLGRKGDGDPGWLTLWRGWQQLELLPPASNWRESTVVVGNDKRVPGEGKLPCTCDRPARACGRVRRLADANVKT